MKYFEYKNDLEFIRNFHQNAMSLKSIERAVPRPDKFLMIGSDYDMRNYIIKKACASNEYVQLRQIISKNVPRALIIARKIGARIDYASYPPAAVGGPIIQHNLVDVILNDNTYGGVEERRIHDTLNEIEGLLELNIKKEFFKLINPFYWIKEILLLVIRLPFVLISITGFNTFKIEEHLFGRIFKIAEILFWLWVVYKLGLNNSEIIKQIFKM